MIIVECCATCRYYEDLDEYGDFCNNEGVKDKTVTPNGWCPEWKERDDDD